MSFIQQTNNNDSESSIQNEKSSIHFGDIRFDLTNVVKILVIGETGSGKSTVINMLTNHFLNGTYDDPKIAIPSKYYSNTTENFPHKENDLQNITTSKTVNCNQYMFIKNNKQYALIDTPGLSDTRGYQQDQNNIRQIIDKVEQLGGLTAVIIVVNGTVGRHTINLRNVLVQLRGNLPDTIMDQIILVLTNTTRYESNFQIEDLKLPGTIFPFYMQNSAFSQDPRTWTEDARQKIRKSWDETMLEIEHILGTVDTFQEKTVEDFTTMKDLRNGMKTVLHEARLEVNQIQTMKDEISTFEDLKKQCENEQISYQDYTTEHEVEKIDIVDADYHSTLCQKCNNVCHEECALDEVTEVGGEVFQQCWAIDNGFCTECTGKCSYSVHYHAKKLIKKTVENINDIIVEIKAKYDQACNNINDYQQKITSTEDAKLMLDQALEKKREDIKNLCLKLNKLCSGFNLVQELYSFVEQLKIESNMLHCLDAKEQAETFITSLKELCDQIAADQKAKNNNVPDMKIMRTERPTSTPMVSNLTEKFQQCDKVTNSTNDSSLSSQPKSHSNKAALQTLLKLVRQKTNVEENKRSDNNDKNDISKPPVSTMDLKEHPKLSVSELVQRYHQCSDERIRKSIVYELELRTLGKSTGIMHAPEAMYTYTRISRKYFSYDVNGLKKVYEELKKRIIAITGPDILDIERIPLEDLIEIHAVYTQLEEQTKNDPSGRDGNSNYFQITGKGDNYYEPIYQSPGSWGTISGRTSPSESVISYDSTDVGKLSTKILLLEHYQARIEQDYRRAHLIFDELRRRCHGDYPSLIQENQGIFNEQCKKYKNKTLDSLKQKVTETETVIDKQVEYNFTRIEEVRKEIILELAALNYLIDPTTIRITFSLEELNTSKTLNFNENK